MKMIKKKGKEIRNFVGSGGIAGDKINVMLAGLIESSITVTVKGKSVNFDCEFLTENSQNLANITLGMGAAGFGDQIVVEFEYEYDVSEASVKFEAYLESIDGLENGYRPYKPSIKSAYFFECGDGWFGILESLITEAIAAGWNKQVCQVKEKFGGLRFYINDASKEVHDIITKYEQQSYTVCEECGEPGELRRDLSWIKTKCDKHYGKG